MRRERWKKVPGSTKKKRPRIIEREINLAKCNGAVLIARPCIDLNSKHDCFGRNRDRIRGGGGDEAASHTALTIIHPIHEYLIGEYKTVNRYGLSFFYVNSLTGFRKGTGGTGRLGTLPGYGFSRMTQLRSP